MKHRCQNLLHQMVPEAACREQSVFRSCRNFLHRIQARLLQLKGLQLIGQELFLDAL